MMFCYRQGLSLFSCLDTVSDKNQDLIFVLYYHFRVGMIGINRIKKNIKKKQSTYIVTNGHLCRTKHFFSEKKFSSFRVISDIFSIFLPNNYSNNNYFCVEEELLNPPFTFDHNNKDVKYNEQKIKELTNLLHITPKNLLSFYRESENHKAFYHYKEFSGNHVVSNSEFIISDKRFIRDEIEVWNNQYFEQKLMMCFITKIEILRNTFVDADNLGNTQYSLCVGGVIINSESIENNIMNIASDDNPYAVLHFYHQMKILMYKNQNILRNPVCKFKISFLRPNIPVPINIIKDYNNLSHFFLTKDSNNYKLTDNKVLNKYNFGFTVHKGRILVLFHLPMEIEISHLILDNKYKYIIPYTIVNNNRTTVPLIITPPGIVKNHNNIIMIWVEFVFKNDEIINCGVQTEELFYQELSYRMSGTLYKVNW